MTSGIVSTTRVRVGAKHRVVNASLDYLHVPFYEDGGSTELAPFTARLGGVSSSGNFTITGTTANIWDTPGVIQPLGNSIIFDNPDMSDLCSLENMTGGLLVLVQLRATENQNTTRYFFQWGAASQEEPGGFGCSMDTSSRLSTWAFPRTTGEPAIGDRVVVPIDDDTYACSSYWDAQGQNAYAGIGGAFSASPTSLAPMIDAGIFPTNTITSPFGFSLLSKHNADGTGSGHINTAGGDLKLSNLWLVRLEDTDALADAREIFAQYNAYPAEVPAGLV